MNIYKVLSITYYIGMAMVFIGVLMHMSELEYGAYVFGGGSLIMIGIRLYNMLFGKPMNKRVHTILLYSSLMLLPATWAMITYRRYWVIFLVLTAILDTYASFRRIKR
ncbi:hypothetical protein J1N10_14570 [Carboxylicivirga sp. A043]|uniref:hypothetical protein n=1 Tax=Carboxylicivirga litoralis TaxID=2816963 RepID=UPI0021CB83C3|nr:hypothetical protein [Carboxylicivirga sp. A043]MCU4157198.1 hypothetical protein [Carboxylicivirga sp. A043]